MVQFGAEVRNVKDIRSERLSKDYEEMLRLQDTPYLSWIAVKGAPPFAEEYLLTVRLRSYALSATRGRYLVSELNGCTVKVSLWDSYPRIAPQIRMLSFPPVFHPNWYSKGTYCPPQAWRPDDSLKDYVLRMLGTLKYDPTLIETKAPANYKALEWYEKHRENQAWFPSDNTALTENSDEQVAALKAAVSSGKVIDNWANRST